MSKMIDEIRKRYATTDYGFHVLVEEHGYEDIQFLLSEV